VTRGDLSAISTYLALKRPQIKKCGFETLGRARPGDWRAGPGRYERHQDFMMYSRTKPRESLLRPRVLVMRPHGRWSVRYRRLKPILTEFMRIFFQRPVRWGKPLDGAFPKRVRGQYGPRRWVQYWTRPILKALKEDRPYNALAVLGVTTEDLYPDSRWNFVFGEARLDHRVGIYSVSRLFPDFYDMNWTVGTLRRGLLLAMKVLSHETGHMLGIHHCVAYACGMNGCNSLVELAKNPLPFCPVCVAKMAWKLRFNVKRRYQKLARFFAKLGYTKQAEFYAQQAWRMGGKGDAPAGQSIRQSGRREPQRSMAAP
jgi:archaemetzincin